MSKPASLTLVFTLERHRCTLGGRISTVPYVQTSRYFPECYIVIIERSERASSAAQVTDYLRIYTMAHTPTLGRHRSVRLKCVDAARHTSEPDEMERVWT